MMTRHRSGIFLLCMLAFRLSVVAQREKMDTTVNDTIVVGAGEPVFRPHEDTSYTAAPGTENTSDPAERPPTLRSVPDTTTGRWQRNPVFAYANDPEYWKKRPQQQNTFSLWLARLLVSKGFRYTILTLLGGLLLFAIVRIAMENNVGLFYRRGKNPRAAGEGAEGLPEEENIDERIQHFLNAGDKRQATRYLYLRSLRLLADRGFIVWHAETTNEEYLRQLKGAPPEAAFRFVTRAYEMVWYGKFILTDSSFRRLYEHFMDLYKTLGA